jgi:hypothetical protein
MRFNAFERLKAHATYLNINLITAKKKAGTEISGSSGRKGSVRCRWS